MMDLLSRSFVQYAFIVGILISLCSALLGVSLVLKRFSFIGDGLSHVAFGAMVVAAVTGLSNNMLIVLPVTLVAAVFLLKGSQKASIKGDAAIAMLSVATLAIGYLLMNLFSTSSNVSGDVCGTLFGSSSILTLSKTDVFLCIVLCIIVLLMYFFFYHNIFSVTFDETFAKATGSHAEIYNLIIAMITAIIIVLAMNLVGALLISALLIFPALSSMRIFQSFRSVILASAIISVFCSSTGILLSVVFSTPVGSTIVVLDLFVFFLCSLIGKILKRS